MRLAYLVFASNECYCRVVDTPPPSVTVDTEKKTWRCKVWSNSDRPIGQSRYTRRDKGGIIGVYDLDDIKQVDSMVSAAIEAQTSDGYCD